MKRQIIDKEQCTGCGACKLSCHFDAISMKADAEGFLYPEVDGEKCTDCNACVNACNRRTDYGEKRRHTYIARNKKTSIREKSTSGGIFGALAHLILQEGGYVFGAAFNEELEVCHIEISTQEELHKLQKSKYVQSDTRDTYRSVKELIKKAKVLYSGTPCQIAGLKAYLGKDSPNLVCVDLICQGVPSPAVWKRYLEYLGGEKRKIERFEFRNKEKGWNELAISYTFSDGEERTVSFEDDYYMEGFEQTEFLRPVCYNCPFRGETGYSDITLGDCWGYKELVKEKEDSGGTSVVLLNTEKGEKIYRRISSQLDEIVEIDVELLKKHNRNLYFNPVFTAKRTAFFREFQAGNYGNAFRSLANTDRRDQYLSILSQWLDGELEHTSRIRNYLADNAYKKVAIYGMGMLGKLLWKELDRSDEIEVVCCIDSNPDSVKEMKVINSNCLSVPLLEDVDLVIITPIHVKVPITTMLQKYYQGNIIGMDELFM